MYYIQEGMKNNILKFVVYLYYLTLIVLLILYLFPGSIIGYFIYGNFGTQPNLLKNPITNKSRTVKIQLDDDDNIVVKKEEVLV